MTDVSRLRSHRLSFPEQKDAQKGAREVLNPERRHYRRENLSMPAFEFITDPNDPALESVLTAGGYMKAPKLALDLPRSLHILNLTEPELTLRLLEGLKAANLLIPRDVDGLAPKGVHIRLNAGELWYRLVYDEEDYAP
jgi:hypothetical protein